MSLTAFVRHIDDSILPVEVDVSMNVIDFYSVVAIELGLDIRDFVLTSSNEVLTVTEKKKMLDYITNGMDELQVEESARRKAIRIFGKAVPTKQDFLSDIMHDSDTAKIASYLEIFDIPMNSCYEFLTAACQVYRVDVVNVFVKEIKRQNRVYDNTAALRASLGVECAASKPQYEISRILITNNVVGIDSVLESVDHVGGSDVTPLLVAVQKNSCDFASFLLSKGADVDAVTSKGRSGLSIACEMGFHNLVRLLIKHKADPNSSNIDGRTPTSFAKERNFRKILKTLTDYRKVHGKHKLRIQGNEG
eukprot:TRINITY_DN1439_c2_g1_i1.p1 TRINITY_DN1439_c2_g1~~TRINITY_DN1439_c2_g1_i1.p1  ORF type:complete len:306 (+),score=57.88 TRINITY_DN1439_c2_g1_i1:68-985(+)